MCEEKNMSWEALRLTSRTPAELLSVLGPQGMDEWLRDARNACWRHEEGAPGQAETGMLRRVRVDRRGPGR